jgi:hypothetical protein
MARWSLSLYECGRLARRKSTNRTNGAAPVRDPGFPMVTHAWARVHRSVWRRLNLLVGKSCRLLEYLHKHFSREFSGLRILVRRMVRGQ